MKKLKSSLIFISFLVLVACSSSTVNRELKEIAIENTNNKYSITQEETSSKKKLEDIIVFNEEGVTIRREGNNLILSMPELILFDFDKYNIKERIKPSLTTLAKALGENEDILIKIDGYTDFIGTESYNLDLSVKRARAIKNFLVYNGAIDNNISIEGYGKQNPIASNQTESGRAKNRRVEFIISRYN